MVVIIEGQTSLLAQTYSLKVVASWKAERLQVVVIN